MAAELTTIARPYAEAVFSRADEAGQLGEWADMLELLAAAVTDPALSGLIANPKLDRAQLVELMLEVGGDALNDEGRNLVRILVANDRLAVVPQIRALFTEMKNAQEGSLDVVVTAAFPMDADQEARLAKALQAKLGREIHITSRQDPELIGGVEVRAGDLVIDGSVRGQLSQLANVLGI